MKPINRIFLFLLFISVSYAISYAQENQSYFLHTIEKGQSLYSISKMYNVYMRKVQFTETVLRDANQSLMATRLPYADYADILPAMDKAGYYSIECWGGATFDSCLRYLNEDPWERLRNLRKNLPNNKLQMLLRGQNLLGYKHYHDDVVEKFIELSIKNGIDIIRIFDALNDFRNCETALNATMKYATKNTIASGCICYTQSPVHTVEKYVEMCKELKRMGFQTICLFWVSSPIL